MKPPVIYVRTDDKHVQRLQRLIAHESAKHGKRVTSSTMVEQLINEGLASRQLDPSPLSSERATATVVGLRTHASVSGK